MRVPRRRVREVVDEPSHIVVHHQRKVRLRRLQLLLHLRRQLRVGRKGHLVGGIQRRRLDRRAEPRALFQRRHLQRVDRIQQMLELVRELRIVLHIHPAGQHQIDRHVEVGTRGLQPPAAIVRHAAAIVPLGLLDQLLHPLRSRSKLVGLRLRHRRSRSRHRRRSGDRRRGCIRRNPARRARLPLRTARQQHQRHARSRHRPPPHPAHHPHPLVVSIKNLSRSFVRKRSVNCKRSAHCKTFAEHFGTHSASYRFAATHLGNAQPHSASRWAARCPARPLRTALCARCAVVASKIEALCTPHGPEPHPQLRHHRAHRPRKVHALRPLAGAHRQRSPRARCRPRSSMPWTSSASAASPSRPTPCA